MRKLRLDPEALSVDSFEAGDAKGGGTVVGHTGDACVEYDYTVLCDTHYTLCQATCRCTDQTYCNQASCIYTCGPQPTCAC